eukprot:TRINITY_DN2620_c0_g1_i1.p1 TRINITY_DN2620_c0_g1~~TRINITY_DN2620_c0_g1_i1.p1  ORF type:complete len:225 (+),score=73.18 TRINITY_DN2620_c0_g1_i1:141-815(+)
MAKVPIVLESKAGVVPTATLIFLHGLGDMGAGWEWFGDIVTKRFRHLRVILPTAPIRKVSINGGYPMTAWYDIKSLSSRDDEDTNGLDESRLFLESLIEKEMNDHNIPSNRILIGGFSQGAAVSLFSTYQSEKQLAGCVALSGYLASADYWSSNLRDANRNTPLLMCHGTRDDVVKFQWATQSRDKLLAHNIPLTFKEYPMRHEANDEEIRAVLDFISERLPSL